MVDFSCDGWNQFQVNSKTRTLKINQFDTRIKVCMNGSFLILEDEVVEFSNIGPQLMWSKNVCSNDSVASDFAADSSFQWKIE